MANFKVKNGLQAGRYLLNSTTLSGSTIDLSLASMFSTTLSSDPAYAFTNPPPSGTAQAFSVEVTGGTTTFTQDSFATTLYTGNGSSQTITNGLDLSTDGGLVWERPRISSNHWLWDSARGPQYSLATDTTSAQSDMGANGTLLTSTGFTSRMGWGSGTPIVAWSFKKQAKFFDIVTYTGDGVAGLTVNHSLGGTVGSMFVKCTSHADDWYVYHIETGATHSSFLNTTAAAAANGAYWNNTAPTTTQFTVGDNAGVNANGRTYVAYLFAHDTASDSRIKCGSYTGTGSAGNFIDLGFKPQWVMIKRSDASGESWYLFDTLRGMPVGGNTADLYANSSAAEDTFLGSVNDVCHPTATGFSVETTTTALNASGGTYIYMAIRGDAATDSAITWPSSVKWPSGLAPTTPAAGTKDLFTFLTTDGGTTYYGKKAAEGIA